MNAGVAEPAVTMSEAQAYVRIETGEEEALLAAMVRSASAICEAFLNQVLIARDFAVDLSVGENWARLPLMPVQSIVAVEQVAMDGTATAMPADRYAVDIDARGDGWVRVENGSAKRIRVSGRAGLADHPNGVPEPIRHGILRLVAHLFASRDEGGGGEPPAAVTALWRPYRRMRMA